MWKRGFVADGDKEKPSVFFKAGFGEGTPQQVSVRGGRWSPGGLWNHGRYLLLKTALPKLPAYCHSLFFLTEKSLRNLLYLYQPIGRDTSTF